MPLEIIGLGQPSVQIVWDDDDIDVWPARELRLRCACAHCQSEFTGERLLDPATVPLDIKVETMQLVGNYGLGVAFSDGHSTGIYRFRDLFANRAPKTAGA